MKCKLFFSVFRYVREEDETDQVEQAAQEQKV